MALPSDRRASEYIQSKASLLKNEHCDMVPPTHPYLCSSPFTFFFFHLIPGRFLRCRCPSNLAFWGSLNREERGFQSNEINNKRAQQTPSAWEFYNFWSAGPLFFCGPEIKGLSLQFFCMGQSKALSVLGLLHIRHQKRKKSEKHRHQKYTTDTAKNRSRQAFNTTVT